MGPSARGGAAHERPAAWPDGRRSGTGQLVEGVIEQLELPDLDDPLAYLHGSYQSVRDLED
jgi:hypothetical protein